MAVSKDTLKAKARGFTISIEKMDEKQRDSTPSGEFGEDYNRLRVLVLQSLPNFAPILPPPVAFYQGGGGRLFTYQSFGEINTYCEQIFQMLSTDDEG
jgi:hypothetical protein